VVVTKSSVLSVDAHRVQQIVNGYETQIDGLLKTDGKATVSLVKQAGRFRDVIGQALKQMYEKAGWTVSIQSGDCQRDGSWYNVNIS
jgi:hypothetical protein